MDISDEEIARAEQRAAEQLARIPTVANVLHDRRTASLCFVLSDGTELTLPIAQLKGLEQASGDDIARFEISPSGLGVHFPTLDADLYLPSLLLDLG